MKALAPAAHALNATGDAVEFSRALQQLGKKAGAIDKKMILAAERAVQARKAVEEAKAGVSQLFGQLNSIENLFAATLKSAKAKIELGSESFRMRNFELFLLELRQERVAAKMSELSAEELVVVKQAWGEAHENTIATSKISSEGISSIVDVPRSSLKPTHHITKSKTQMKELLNDIRAH